jgi:hypothetical protein
LTCTEIAGEPILASAEAARHIEVVQRDVVGIAEESIFDQFPSRQDTETIVMLESVSGSPRTTVFQA